jgi:hypothetical protein
VYILKLATYKTWLDAVFGLLVAELAVATVFVILPLPLSWRKRLMTVLARSQFVGQINYVVRRLLSRKSVGTSIKLKKPQTQKK